MKYDMICYFDIHDSFHRSEAYFGICVTYR